MRPDRHPALPRPHAEALEARFALRAAALLTARTQDFPQDISERLRFAREQAIERGRVARKPVVATASAPVRFGHTLALAGAGGIGGAGGRGDSGPAWWQRFGAILPLVALVAGLLLIQDWHGTNEISAAAEVDASLLADDLPPSAYTDEGFLEYLKSAQE